VKREREGKKEEEEEGERAEAAKTWCQATQHEREGRGGMTTVSTRTHNRRMEEGV
jgi:hypothetical protein